MFGDMLDNMQNKDIKTLGYVIRRTNYGEADRILTIITPSGKLTVMAKGVRKEKSKLAGGIEMFTLAEYNIHFGKGEFGILTGARMKKYYGGIIKDLNKLELAANILKKTSRAADGSDSPEFFDIVDQGLKAIDANSDLRMVETWCLLNMKRVGGEEINLYRDVLSQKLIENARYEWNTSEMAFAENANGEYGAEDIKLLRLMTKGDLRVVQRVKMHDGMMAKALRLAQMVI